MTAPTPLVSDVLRGIEELAATSLKHLRAARELIDMAAKAEAAAMETATSLLGEARGKTALELARLPVSSEILETVSAIHKAVEGFAVAEPISRQVSSPEEKQMPAVEARPISPNGRIDFFGIMVPAGRASEAEEVIAAARAAVAQNHKTNPYDHYRGKNAWFKSLFLAAYSQITSQTADPPPASENQPLEQVTKSVPSGDTDAPARASVVAAGPVRGPRQGYFVRGVAPQPAAPSPAPSSDTAPRLQPSGSRLHAHGTTAQTIPEEVLQQSVAQQPLSRGRPNFSRNRKV